MSTCIKNQLVKIFMKKLMMTSKTTITTLLKILLIDNYYTELGEKYYTHILNINL
jgi:hypothetical protein